MKTVRHLIIIVANNYLKDRSLRYQTTEGQQKMMVRAGTAQGSIPDPDFWNVSYDSVLRAETPEETCLLGYADGVAALIVACDVVRDQLKLNRIMRIVNSWTAAHGLVLAF